MITAMGETVRLGVLMLSLKVAMVRRAGVAHWASWIIFSVVGIAAGLGSIALLVWLRTHDDGPTVVAVLMGVLLVGWTVLTVVTQGGEAFVDPRKFLLYPIPEGRLSGALLVAGVLSAPAVGTALFAVGLMSQARSVPGAFGIAVTAALLVVFAITAGRVLLRIVGYSAFGKRARSVMTGVVVVLSGLAGLAGPLFSQVAGRVTIEHFRTARSILRWTPFGWPGEAVASFAQGDHARGLLPLGLTAVSVVALLRAWQELTARALTCPESAATSNVEGGLVPSWMLALVSGPTAAVWARSLRQIRRDPRELLETASMLPLFVMAMIPGFEALRAGDDRVVLSLAPLGISLAMTGFNMFGADGPSHGVDLLTAPSPRHVIVGKTLARVALGVPLIVGLTLGLCVAIGGWRYAVPSIAASFCALLTMIGFGSWASVKFPFPLPERIGTQGTKPGFAVVLLRFVAIGVSAVVAGPGIAVAILVALFAPGWVVPIAVIVTLLWGLAAYRWFTGRAADRIAAFGPELFQELAKAD